MARCSTTTASTTVVACAVIGLLPSLVFLAYSMQEDSIEDDHEEGTAQRWAHLCWGIARLPEAGIVVGALLFVSVFVLHRQGCKQFLKKIRGWFHVPLAGEDESQEHSQCQYMMESTRGARLRPSCPALWFYPACAISGYETGDPLKGIREGEAEKACCLNAMSCCLLGSLYAVLRWTPDPANIQGEGRLRTVNQPCGTAFLLGGSCTISFWESGDLCTNQCGGDAKRALCGAYLPFFSVLYATCFWKPQSKYFQRTPLMDGGEALIGDPVQVSMDDQKLVDASGAADHYVHHVHNYIVLPGKRIAHISIRRRSLGVKSSVEECLLALQRCPIASTAVWRRGIDNALYVLDIGDSILAGPLTYIDMPAAVSFQKFWLAVPGKHIDYSHGPQGDYKGGLGDAWCTEECLSLLRSRDDVNYAVWRRDTDSTLHMFDLSKQISSGALKYYDLENVVSFQTSTVNFV